MRRLEAVILLTAVLVLVSPAWSDSVCQYAHVVDPCGKKVFVLDAGETEPTCFVALDEGPPGEYEPRGVDHATLPGENDFWSFVSQGPFLQVLHPEFIWGDEQETIAGILPSRTVDLEADLGLAGIELAGLHAARPVVVNSQVRYFLYAAGTRVGETTEPWLVVFDQQELLTDGEFDPTATLRFATPLCPGEPDCEGTAVDVVVSVPLPGGSQEVHVSVLAQVDGQTVQQFRKVVIQESGSYTVSLEPWNDEGVAFDGSAPHALGLDYESQGLQPYGVFQTSSVVADLLDGETSCDLVIEPTDVEVWGPDTALDDPYVRFVSATNPYGVDTLYGFPEGGCPFSEYVPLTVAPGALVHVTGEEPLALALSSDTDRQPWIYTANGSGGVSAVRVEIGDDPVEGDTIELLEQLEIELGGCPSAISFRDDRFKDCIIWLSPDIPDPPGPRPPDECEPGDIDPWCLHEFGEKPGGDPD